MIKHSYQDCVENLTFNVLRRPAYWMNPNTKVSTGVGPSTLEDTNAGWNVLVAVFQVCVAGEDAVPCYKYIIMRAEEQRYHTF